MNSSNSKSINDIRDEIEENVETLREMVVSMRRNLRALSKMGMPGAQYFEDCVVAHLTILTDHAHGYLARETTLSDLLDGVNTFIAEKAEDGESED